MVYKKPSAGKDGVASAVVVDTRAIRIGSGGTWFDKLVDVS
jgi:hypothetical protein